MKNSLLTGPSRIKNCWIYLGLFIITFLLYVPAIKAGWVIDGVGFLYNLRHQGFWEFINRTHSEDPSFYQVLTLQYYIGYKLWGLNFWMWGMLYILMQSFNAWLFFLFCKQIFVDSRLRYPVLIPLLGTLLFAVNPHISEIVICKAYFHYLQSFMFIFLILLWTTRYQKTTKVKYLWFSAIVFVLAIFTLEIFYLIPFLVGVIALYYHFALGYDRKVFIKTITGLVIPQVVLLMVYFAGIYLAYGHLRPHKIAFNQAAIDYLSKPMKYIFHIVFLGRYFPFESKKSVYEFFQSETALFIFYGMALVFLVYWFAGFKKMSAEGRAMLFFLVLCIGAVAFLLPLPFPDPALLVFYDRYTYFADGFIYVLMAMFLFYFANLYVGLPFMLLYACLNLYFTIELNTYWKHSAYISSRLLHNLPDPGDKIVVLLNIPENMYGVPMIGAQPDGEFAAMKEVYTNKPDNHVIYDAASYNMIADTNGAHITVSNDSVLHVTLNQWGTWWWYEGHGGHSYENKDYKLNMVDGGHWYELTLKHPASRYLLLYEVGDQWKKVDMSKREEQW